MNRDRLESNIGELIDWFDDQGWVDRKQVAVLAFRSAGLDPRPDLCASAINDPGFCPPDVTARHHRDALQPWQIAGVVGGSATQPDDEGLSAEDKAFVAAHQAAHELANGIRLTNWHSPIRGYGRTIGGVLVQVGQLESDHPVNIIVGVDGAALPAINFMLAMAVAGAVVTDLMIRRELFAPLFDEPHFIVGADPEAVRRHADSRRPRADDADHDDTTAALPAAGH
jgi:hypothetical protein